MTDTYSLLPFNDTYFTSTVAPAIQQALIGDTNTLRTLCPQDSPEKSEEKKEDIIFEAMYLCLIQQNGDKTKHPSFSDDILDLPEEISSELTNGIGYKGESIPQFLLGMIETREVDRVLTDYEKKLITHLHNLTYRFSELFNWQHQHFQGYIAHDELHDFKECLEHTESDSNEISDEVALLIKSAEWALQHQYGLIYTINL